ncbi:efflux RND transporter periplasmic adaptor subunit [Lutispora sp.]|uniref:efflux RND transporter periplasmic adaptor subunit n=1 Tax=Lutispora sp. TaxID=2828727 RepID=UPI002B1F6D15|nr:efflux RND transporter periplasmic adaptor subunit [Lutispora sp.]MEA4963080.1 efflux RND transporter periplasmic adaptor subunit [Lutispora sp.]
MPNKIMYKKNILRWLFISFAGIIAVIAVIGMNAAEVRVEAVRKGNLKEIIELQGKVEAENRIEVYGKLQGFIDETNVKEGDVVKEGSVLLKLSPEDLNYAIRRAEAMYNASNAQLQSLRSSIKPEHVKLAEAELKQAQAVMEAALQDYKNKQDSCEKLKVLYDNGGAAEKDIKDAGAILAASEGELIKAEQAVHIAQYNLDILNQGVSQDDIRALESNSAAAKAELDELVNNKGKASIYSPINGIVFGKYVKKGQAVQPGTLLYEIGDYDSAYIKVDVLVDDISKIKEGQEAVMSGDVLGDKGIRGEVYFIAPKAEDRLSTLGVEQQRVEVRISFDNTALKLKPGYTLDVDIITKEKADSIYIPDKSVFDLDGKDSVFIVQNNKLELRTIECGIENDDFIEVLSGLDEGEKVVVDPESGLKPGRRVKQKP